jgi:23S rRNA pseudouridine1911/1915/1917 synthase
LSILSISSVISKLSTRILISWHVISPPAGGPSRHRHLHRDTLIELATGYLLQKGSLKEGEEPALVHRIDRDTSGVILIAKNKRTTRKLHETFRQHDIIKQYIAVCHHRPPELEEV